MGKSLARPQYLAHSDGGTIPESSELCSLLTARDAIKLHKPHLVALEDVLPAAPQLDRPWGSLGLLHYALPFWHL